MFILSNSLLSFVIYLTQLLSGDGKSISIFTREYSEYHASIKDKQFISLLNHTESIGEID
jgi:hypothetical protein